MRSKFVILALSLATTAIGQRIERVLNDGWSFSRDKKQWEEVKLPHDWAISGPFDKKWDLQFVAIEQNNEKEKTEKSGRSGALPWIGKGYYKAKIHIPDGYKHAELLFDGAMSEPQIFVNGQKAEYVGNICMDVAMIDVTGIDCHEGDSVEIFGDNLPVTVLSDVLDTIPYEVLTGISNRVKRIYFQD